MDNPQQGSELSLEKALAALESIVERLSSPGNDLDTLLKLYEEGVGYLGVCNARLKDAETKIVQLNAVLDQARQSEDGNG
jgi:exodeoxyribonuclease VII small subunit